MSLVSDVEDRFKDVEDEVKSFVASFEPKVQAELKEDLSVLQDEVATLKANGVTYLAQLKTALEAELASGAAALNQAVATAAPEVQAAVQAEISKLVAAVESHLA